MIKNLTKNTIVSKGDLNAKNIFDKYFGMILKRNSIGLILETRFGIHTFFIKNPIDIVVLDKSNKVVQMQKSLKPNRIFIWNPKFSKIIELPENSLQISKTELGDKLKF